MKTFTIFLIAACVVAAVYAYPSDVQEPEQHPAELQHTAPEESEATTGERVKRQYNSGYYGGYGGRGYNSYGGGYGRGYGGYGRGYGGYGGYGRGGYGGYGRGGYGGYGRGYGGYGGYGGYYG